LKYGHPKPAGWQASREADVAVYRWTLSGIRQLTVWVIPTVRGDLALVCSAPVGTTGAMRACDTMASRVRVSGVARLPVGPDAKLAQSVAGIVSTAATSRRELAGMYSGHARRPAAVPSQLAAADQRAQTMLKELKVPPRFDRAVSGLAAGFGAEAQGLTALSSATAKDNQQAYTKSTQTIGTDGRDLSSLTGDLRRVGLLSFALSPLVIPKLPITTGAPSSGTGATGTANPPTTYTPPSTSGTPSGKKSSGGTSQGGPIH
jgi:hypothetical protein